MIKDPLPEQPEATHMIDIDGSFGEGGGQVLRTALTLSALTGKAAHIKNIRANRPKPGMAPQHLTNVMALAKICNAQIRGAHLRSTELLFKPQSPPIAGNYLFDVTDVAPGGSAGSVTLILQTLLLPLAFTEGDSKLILIGGTHVPWSPSYQYIADVFLRTLSMIGLHATCRLSAWGFYPIGGGKIKVTISGLTGKKEAKHKPKHYPLKILARGNFNKIFGHGVASNLPSHIAKRLAGGANSFFRSHGLASEITPLTVTGAGPGAGLFFTAEYDNCYTGFAAIGKRGKPAELVAEEGCLDFMDYHHSGHAIDRHLADQLLLPLALIKGESVYQTELITKHLTTNAAIIQNFVAAEIDVQGAEGQPGIVKVIGITPH